MTTCSIFLFVELTKTIKISFSYIQELLAPSLFSIYSFCPLSFFYSLSFCAYFSCSFCFLHNLFIFIFHPQFTLSYAPSFYEHCVFLYFLDLWLFAPICYISVLCFYRNCSCTFALQEHYILVIISSMSTMFSCVASTYNYLHFPFCKRFLFIGFVCALCCFVYLVNVCSCLCFSFIEFHFKTNV